MDIVTHALMGVAVAGPCLIAAPAASAGFILGSVLPDVDAFSRIFGKRCFLTWHQTFTHSVGAMLCVATTAAISSAWNYELFQFLLGISFGMLFHSLLDFTNTFGVKLWFPFYSKRVCLEWVFFIDSIVLGITLTALAALAWALTTAAGPSIWQSVIYLVAIALYFMFKGWLRQRALRQLPHDVLSLIPSAFLPWLFMGYRRSAQHEVELMDYNLLKGAVIKNLTIPIFDERWAKVLEASSYFQTMRSLSAGYHVVSACAQSNGEVLVGCRDLRTRNFATTFGELDVCLDDQNRIKSQQLKV